MLILVWFLIRCWPTWPLWDKCLFEPLRTTSRHQRIPTCDMKEHKKPLLGKFKKFLNLLLSQLIEKTKFYSFSNIIIFFYQYVIQMNAFRAKSTYWNILKWKMPKLSLITICNQLIKSDLYTKKCTNQQCLLPRNAATWVWRSRVPDSRRWHVELLETAHPCLVPSNLHLISPRYFRRKNVWQQNGGWYCWILFLQKWM